MYVLIYFIIYIYICIAALDCWKHAHHDMVSAFRALKRGARVILMGGLTVDAALPPSLYVRTSRSKAVSTSLPQFHLCHCFINWLCNIVSNGVIPRHVLNYHIHQISPLSIPYTQAYSYLNLIEWMCPMELIPELIRMMELGILQIGSAAGITGMKYSLDDWEHAFRDAKKSVFGRCVVFEP